MKDTKLCSWETELFSDYFNLARMELKGIILRICRKFIVNVYLKATMYKNPKQGTQFFLNTCCAGIL
jgi:hypothetical protein